MERVREAYLEETRRAHPAIGDDQSKKHRVVVKCTCKCTYQWEGDQWNCKNTGEVMSKLREFDLCQMSGLLPAKAAPNETENDLRIYQMAYLMASQDTLTEWHPSKTTVKDLSIGIQLNDYREPSTEGTDCDVYTIACLNQSLTTILEADNPTWPMLMK